MFQVNFGLHFLEFFDLSIEFVTDFERTVEMEFRNVRIYSDSNGNFYLKSLHASFTPYVFNFGFTLEILLDF